MLGEPRTCSTGEVGLLKGASVAVSGVEHCVTCSMRVIDDGR